MSEPITLQQAAKKALDIVDPGAVNNAPVSYALHEAIIAGNTAIGGNRVERWAPEHAPARLIMSQLRILIGLPDEIDHTLQWGADYATCKRLAAGESV